MPENFRALIVVLLLAAIGFYIARQAALPAVNSRELRVWTRSWLILAIAAFLSTSFLMFSVVCAIVCIYNRSASRALYFPLLLAVPPVGQIIGIGPINQLFELTNPRILALLFLGPPLIAEFRKRGARPYLVTDRLILVYVATSLLVDLGSTNATHLVRLATVQCLDVLIPYFAFSRLLGNAEEVRRVLVAVVIAALPLSIIAVFESGKGWLLYSSVVGQWQGYDFLLYLQRDGILRAAATGLSPIVLGYALMVAIGCLLGFHERVGRRIFLWIIVAALAGGLVASLSRGPWVGMSAGILAFLLVGPRPASRIVTLAAILGPCLVLFLLSPVGARLIDLLPFVGTVDAGNVTYRQTLFENALIVINRNFWFGSNDYFTAPELQAMRQGQGIIDIVNTYLQIALELGVVGLALFIAVFLSSLLPLYRAMLALPNNSETKSLTRSVLAVMISILVTIGTVSSISYVPAIYWSFAGISVALIRAARRELRQSPTPAAAVETRVAAGAARRGTEAPTAQPHPQKQSWRRTGEWEMSLYHDVGRRGVSAITRLPPTIIRASFL
jgi:O-antigen ligase